MHYSEVRTGARLSYVEAVPGVVIVLPSWMLDAGACADMTLGAPQRRSADGKPDSETNAAEQDLAAIGEG